MQRCFTRRIFGLRHPPYSQRLAELNLPTLKRRRDIADVVFAYHVLHGLVKVDSVEFGLSLSTLSTRGHNMNTVMKRPSSKYVSRAFNYRVAKLWKSMSNECKQVLSMYNFKKLVKMQWCA